MTTAIARKRIRLAADAAKQTTAYMLDQFTSATPELWRGNDVQFEIALFVNDAIVDDLSNIASLSVEVKDAADRDGAALMTKTLAAADLTACTDENWTNHSGQHASVAFTAAEANVAIESGNTRNCWLVVSVTTIDDPGRQVTIQATSLLLVEDGTGDAGVPPNNTDNYYTKGSADARYQQKHADGASIAFKDGQHPYLYCTGDAKWYPLVVSLVDGIAVLGLGEGVDSI